MQLAESFKHNSIKNLINYIYRIGVYIIFINIAYGIRISFIPVSIIYSQK